MANSTINLHQSGSQLDYPVDSNNLLEALEQHQIAVEYQCRSGYCGTCRLVLLKGEVDYLTQPLALIQEGEILPCCCKPRGDIAIEI
ncbi:class I ribonucleotide reductase maintenance protein YfaE [Candidatus Fukatsuia symbiotica]|uniref:2Fe-2S ferredoxin n=1 Tax=Candidatus Fukatsuia symbiotica TaxID=1878942 RepID=A0A2U8I8E4_9GAMM|nr:class I ribonucleotide reductase maintenance protein YfaE [Candidatus Fukatsuia symbiotica]AWK15383.1 2Fe-2S ferredoxin [Candidatus Fukatsuia symbiotica]MEA9444766.1 class I ribonucleotide reductase maintenance protein YfaE [Candidatus Fukatsuia symbiotica]